MLINNYTDTKRVIWKIKHHPDSDKLRNILNRTINAFKNSNETLCVITSYQKTDNLYWGYLIGKEIRTCMWKKYPTHGDVIDFSESIYSIDNTGQLLLNPNESFIKHFNFKITNN